MYLRYSHPGISHATPTTPSSLHHTPPNWPNASAVACGTSSTSIRPRSGSSSLRTSKPQANGKQRQGGEYFAVGVLGAVTGRRADIVIIDDPVKSRLEADSETVRERVWEWWKADLLTRLKPGAKIVLVMTRWHEDDLGGRLLAEMDAGGRKWEVLRLPMEAEADDPLGRAPAEPLWPEWFTDDMRADAKRDPRTWSALYQQRPAPDTGTYFERDWLRPANAIPRRDDMRTYGASDYAVTANDGDWTVHVIIGVDPGRSPVAARPVARPDGIGPVDRELLRSGAPVAPDRLGGGARADQGGYWAVPRSTDARARSVRRAPALPHPRRQGGAGTVHSRADGVGRASLPRISAVACRVRGGADELPGREA